MRRSIFHCSLFAAIATAVFLISFSAAAERPYHIDVHFEELTLDMQRHSITVDYIFDRDDWHRAKRLGVTPHFNLSIPLDDGDDIVIARHVEMAERTGTIRLYTHHLMYRFGIVHFEPLAAYRTSRVGDVQLGGDFSHDLRFTLFDGPTTYRGTERRDASNDPWAQRRGADRSRSDRTSRRRTQRRNRHRDRRSERRGRDRQHRDRSDDTRYRADIITACGNATSFESTREKCIDSAPDIGHRDAVETINACGDATSHSSHFESCLTVATDYQAPPSSTVRACGEATSHGSHFVECLEAAADYEHDASPIVDSCGDSTSFSGRVADCVYDATR